MCYWSICHPTHTDDDGDGDGDDELMAVIVRWCPPLSVYPYIGRHTRYKTLSQNEDDKALSKKMRFQKAFCQ